MAAKYTPAQIDAMSTDELVRAMGEAWYTNDMETWLSLFTEDATIRHPLFPEPIKPEVAADVMNGLVRKTGLLAEPQVHRPAGATAMAGEDLVEMAYAEAKPGTKLSADISRTPEVGGNITMTARISNHRVAFLHVHGFDVASAAR